MADEFGTKFIAPANIEYEAVPANDALSAGEIFNANEAVTLQLAVVEKLLLIELVANDDWVA